MQPDQPTIENDPATDAIREHSERIAADPNVRLTNNGLRSKENETFDE